MARPPTLALLSSVRERFQRAVNCVMHSHKEGGWYIRLPGLKYDDFNRAGLPNIVKLDRLAEVVRVQQVSGIDISRMTLFFIGRRWTFSSRLYDRAAVDFPMTLRSVISAVGKTTYDTQVSYIEGHGDESAIGSKSNVEPLATVVYRVIHIDPEAYRPSPLPKEFAGTLTSNLIENGERYPTFIPPMELPDKKTYRCRIRVRYDDMDMLFHTNHGSYLAFALECAAQAAEAGFYSKIRGDVAFYQPKSTTSIHMGQSKAGDELDVATWEDDDNKLLLHFAISNDGTVIYYAQLEYFENQDSPAQSKL